MSMFIQTATRTTTGVAGSTIVQYEVNHESPLIFGLSAPTEKGNLRGCQLYNVPRISSPSHCFKIMAMLFVVSQFPTALERPDSKGGIKTRQGTSKGGQATGSFATSFGRIFQ